MSSETLVMKFGGTSLADSKHIAAAAQRVATEAQNGKRVAVVVSAMAGTTDMLSSWIQEAGTPADLREADCVLAAGEQITAGLMSLHLHQKGLRARSWLGWQLPIETDSHHGAAKISRLPIAHLQDELSQGIIAVVAGFQGVEPQQHRVSTLGRGGSDTSAVALAAALQASECTIYTDVDGVYTADPRIVPRARKLTSITYEEMLEMASAGAKVLHGRAVALAMHKRVPIRVLSSHTGSPGTRIVSEEQSMENSVVNGIVYAVNEARITLVATPDRPGVAYAVFGIMGREQINVDMIVQSQSAQGDATDITFTVERKDLKRCCQRLEEAQKDIGFAHMDYNASVAKISIVGVGMRQSTGVAAQMFETLANKGINIQVISTSEIKVSVLIDEEYTELAVRSLHSRYGLDSQQSLM